MKRVIWRKRFRIERCRIAGYYISLYLGFFCFTFLWGYDDFKTGQSLFGFRASWIPLTVKTGQYLTNFSFTLSV